MKKLLPIVLLFTVLNAFAQPNFAVLRKHNQTIKIYFPTSYIVFQLSNKQWVEGRIKAIKDDSLIINQMALRNVINYLGLFAIDTVRLGIFKVSVNEIYALPKENESFGFIRNGSLLQIAGAGYLALNTINGIGKSEPFFSANNSPRLAAGVGLFALGTLLHLTYNNTYILGKKYMFYTSNNISVK